MAERPMEPQAFNTLTSFYKNKGFKPKNPSKSVFVSWLYYGTSEMKDGNKFSASLRWKTGEKKKTIIDQTWLYGKKKLFFSIRQQ